MTKRNNNALHLHFFRPAEFGPTRFRRVDWWHCMCPRLLVLLDVFRFQWDKPVRISNNDYALGRNLGEADSQHNVDRWGEVRALDCFPNGLNTREDAELAIELATQVGFTGIGLYPHWRGGPGLHLDTRRDQKPGEPATWGAVDDEHGNQVYVTLNEALLAMSGKGTDTTDRRGTPQDFTEQHPTGVNR